MPPPVATGLAPSASKKLTVVATLDGFDRLTVNTAKPAFSTTGAWLTTLKVGVSSSPPIPVPTAPVPSSLMVVVTVGVAIVALLGVFKLTLKASLPSYVLSSKIATVMVCVSGPPGVKVSVPELAVKSLPATAVPLAVL